MSNSVRKNITLSESEYQIISDYARKTGMSFSELVRKSTLKEIELNEQMSLLEFLNNYTDFVSDKEQAEIDALEIDFEDVTGKELSLDEIL